MSKMPDPKPIVGRYLSGFCQSGDHARCPVSVRSGKDVYLCAHRCHPGQKGLKQAAKR